MWSRRPSYQGPQGKKPVDIAYIVDEIIRVNKDFVCVVNCSSLSKINLFYSDYPIKVYKSGQSVSTFERNVFNEEKSYCDIFLIPRCFFHVGSHMKSNRILLMFDQVGKGSSPISSCMGKMLATTTLARSNREMKYPCSWAQIIFLNSVFDTWVNLRACCCDRFFKSISSSSLRELNGKLR